jgi:hypothetical protein
MQDRCSVWAECTIRSEIILDAPDGTPRRRVMWNLVLICLETVLVSVQDRCTVCAKHTTGLENVLDKTDGTPRG